MPIPRTLIPVLAAAVVACGGPSLTEPPELPRPQTQPPEDAVVAWIHDPSREAQVFAGETGARAEVVPIRSQSSADTGEYYLIRLRGVQDERNDKVLLARRKQLEVGPGYVANVHGEPRSMVFKPNSYSDDWSIFDKQPLRAREVPVPPGTAEELLSSFREQNHDGVTQTIAPRDRASRERAQTRILDESTRPMQEACDAPMPEVDWSTVEDVWFEELSIASSCAKLDVTLRFFCENYPHRKSEFSKPVTCSLDGDPRTHERPKLERQKDGSWRYHPSRSNRHLADVAYTLVQELGEQDQLLKRGSRFLLVREESKAVRVYAGDGKAFYPIGIQDHRQSGHLRSYDLYRGEREARLRQNENGWQLVCDASVEPLSLVVGKERDAIIASATYESEPRSKREPYFLARDSRGTYYYVDRYRKELGGKRFRVFIGRRGQTKLSKLRGLVEDTEGTVFSTENGELRLVVSAGSASGTWHQQNKQTALTTVSIPDNMRLIYDELGVYAGEDLGHLCDQ